MATYKPKTEPISEDEGKKNSTNNSKMEDLPAPKRRKLNVQQPPEPDTEEETPKECLVRFLRKRRVGIIDKSLSATLPSKIKDKITNLNKNMDCIKMRPIEPMKETELYSPCYFTSTLLALMNIISRLAILKAFQGDNPMQITRPIRIHLTPIDKHRAKLNCTRCHYNITSLIQDTDHAQSQIRHHYIVNHVDHISSMVFKFTEIDDFLTADRLLARFMVNMPTLQSEIAKDNTHAKLQLLHLPVSISLGKHEYKFTICPYCAVCFSGPTADHYANHHIKTTVIDPKLSPPKPKS